MPKSCMCCTESFPGVMECGLLQVIKQAQDSRRLVHPAVCALWPAAPARTVQTSKRCSAVCMCMLGGSQGDERLRTVGLLVLDEAHYLGDQDRGTVWEEVIISALAHIRILAMSATISNAEQLGGWLSKVCTNPASADGDLLQHCQGLPHSIRSSHPLQLLLVFQCSRWLQACCMQANSWG